MVGTLAHWTVIEAFGVWCRTGLLTWGTLAQWTVIEASEVWWQDWTVDMVGTLAQCRVMEAS